MPSRAQRANSLRGYSVSAASRTGAGRRATSSLHSKRDRVTTIVQAEVEDAALPPLEKPLEDPLRRRGLSDLAGPAQRIGVAGAQRDRFERRRGPRETPRRVLPEMGVATDRGWVRPPGVLGLELGFNPCHGSNLQVDFENMLHLIEINFEIPTHLLTSTPP